MFWCSFKKSFTKKISVSQAKKIHLSPYHIFFLGWYHSSFEKGEHIYLIITVRTKGEDGVFYMVPALAHPYSHSVSLYIQENKRIKATYAGKKQKIRIGATEAW